MATVATDHERDGALILRAGKPSWRYAVEPFQQAFWRTGMTQDELGKLCGFSTGYLGRVLGLRRYCSGRRGARRWTVARTLSYQNAVKIATALDLDFVELGL